MTQTRYTASDLPRWIRYHAQQGDTVQAAYYQQLHATANGRYDFGTATLNPLVNFQPVTFAEWLANLSQV